METIKNYLDNMFANLAKNAETIKLKNDLLLNMEEKYNELKNDGKSENEAIGIVISEFGNIEELMEELGIEEKRGPVLQTITKEDADNFIAAKKQEGGLVGIGVFLCIIGVAMLIFLTALTDEGIIGQGLSSDFTDMFGIIALFIMIVPAVGLFIYAGMKLEKYKYLREGFDISLQVRTMIEQKQNAFSPTYMVSVIMGVCLCVLSPVAIFVASAFGDSASNYGVVVLLLMVAMAVFLFIYFGNIKESFSILLKKTHHYSKVQTKNFKIIGVVAAIVWPLAICGFLISGLVFHLWYINWIVFPITGILFGMFSAVYGITQGRSDS
ncbi:MAG TPA: permease prefix domain 1-containing protein [Desulfosporosinus sp.]|nr:permease prefix domain 1-containing protein [Desulfosporosinus sp.]